MIDESKNVSVWRAAWPLVLGVIALVLLPLFVLGFGFEDQVGQMIERTVEPVTFAVATIVVLAGDVLLPVPSSLVNTLAGSRLGIIVGTLVAWLGMNLGAIIAFALARTLGRPIVTRFTNPADLASLEQLADRRGNGLLVVTRALPVLAEATVLLVGSLGVSWRAFLPPVLLANLGLALAYAVLGALAYEHGLLSIALVASVVVPLLATFVARLFMK
jgi:uncharacterized membrane protein YdjX (TVP38/TMEM64 family)